MFTHFTADCAVKLKGETSTNRTFCFLAGFEHKHIVPMLPCLDIMRRSCVHQGNHLMITPPKYYVG